MAPHAVQQRPGGPVSAATQTPRPWFTVAVVRAGSAARWLARSTALPSSWPRPPPPLTLPSPIVLPTPTAGLPATFPAGSAASSAVYPATTAVLPSLFLPTSMAAPCAVAAAMAMALPAASVAAAAVAPAVPRPMPSRTLELSKLQQALQRQQAREAGLVAPAARQSRVSSAALAHTAWREVVDVKQVVQLATPGTQQQTQQQQQQQQQQQRQDGQHWQDVQLRQTQYPDHDSNPSPPQSSGLQVAQIMPHYDPWQGDARLQPSVRTAVADNGPAQPSHEPSAQQQPGSRPSATDALCDPWSMKAPPQPSQLSAGARPPGDPAHGTVEHRDQPALGDDPWAEDDVESSPWAATSAQREEWSPILYTAHQEQSEQHDGQSAPELLHTSATAAAPQSVGPGSRRDLGVAPSALLPAEQTPCSQQPAEALPYYDPFGE